jgi:EpsG family
VTKKAALLRLIFVTCAIVLSIGLSLRPIPGLDDTNDTGRYVANQAQACSLPFSGSSAVIHDSSIVLRAHFDNLTAAGDPSLTISARAWDWINRPACLGGSSRVFLFYVAMAVPIALLFFANWDYEATLLVALGLLLSTVGFEFMTNALRQGVALPFLLAGFYFKKRLPKFAAIAIAMVLHDSNWIFAPLAILVAYSAGTISIKIVVRWAIPLLAAAGFLFSLRFLSRFGQLSTAFTTYVETYAEQPSVLFLLYIISPLFLVFLIRCLDRQAKATREEQITFWYSTTILCLSILVFPYITHRFAMTGIALQVFMALRSPNLSVRSGGWISAGLVAHFTIYAIFAKNVTALFYG